MTGGVYIDSEVAGSDGISKVVYTRLKEFLHLKNDVFVAGAGDVKCFYSMDVAPHIRGFRDRDLYYRVFPVFSASYNRELAKRSARVVFDTMFEASRIPYYSWPVLEQADKHIAANNYIMDLLSERIPERKIAIVPISLECMENTDERLDVGGRFVFLCVARFEIRKNIKGLIDAFGKAFQGDDNVCLLLKTCYCGRISLQEKLQRLVTYAVPRIYAIDEFLSRGEMVKIYRSSHAFVTATRGEGYCLPLLEAMSAGLPVIAPNHTAMKDYLTDENAFIVRSSGQSTLIHDGVSYCVTHNVGATCVSQLEFEYPNVNEDDLVEHMRFVYDHYDSAKVRGARGLEHVATRLSTDTVSRQLREAVYS